jgi:hypothetical protein
MAMKTIGERRCIMMKNLMRQPWHLKMKALIHKQYAILTEDRSHPPDLRMQLFLDCKIGQFFKTDASWDNLLPLKPLPETVYLEQDVFQPTFLSRQELRKLKELSYIDKMNEEWDPENEIEKILRHRHT